MGFSGIDGNVENKECPVLGGLVVLLRGLVLLEVEIVEDVLVGGGLLGGSWGERQGGHVDREDEEIGDLVQTSGGRVFRFLLLGDHGLYEWEVGDDSEWW